MPEPNGNAPYSTASLESVRLKANIKKRCREETSLSITKIFHQERGKFFRENTEISNELAANHVPALEII